MITLKMNDDETPQDFKSRAKAQCDATAQLLQPEWLTGVLKADEDYLQANDVKKTELGEGLWEEFQAYLLLHGAHPLKYGQLKKDLRQFAVPQDDKYPKTLEGMCEALHRSSLPILPLAPTRFSQFSSDCDVVEPGFKVLSPRYRFLPCAASKACQCHCLGNTWSCLGQFMVG
jgi:hypothetical protein